MEMSYSREGNRLVLFFLSLAILPFAWAKEELLFSEYTPTSVEELNRLSVAMNCLVNHYQNATEVQECLECFFPVSLESLECYGKFFTGSESEKCFLTDVEELNEENREEVLFNITSCIDFNLRVKTIDFCVKKLSLNQFLKRDLIVESTSSCFTENMNLLFNEAVKALQSSPWGSVEPVKTDILNATYHIEVISKCEEVDPTTLQECKACFNEVLNSEDRDVPTIFKDSLACSDKYLNPVFGKCFNSESFSGKSFGSAYEAKRAMGSCLHENTDNILKEVCTFNLPGEYLSSPRPNEVYSLVAACIEYHHIKLHNVHFGTDLLKSLKLHDDYILAVNGITEEVKSFFDKIVISQVSHHV